MKREDEPVEPFEPVVDVSFIKASPTTLASKLFSVLMFYAIPVPSMASLHQLVATKARPDIMHALVQEMVFCFVAAHSPQAQIRNRLSFNVSKGDVTYHYLIIPIFNLLLSFKSHFTHCLGIDTAFL